MRITLFSRVMVFLPYMDTTWKLGGGMNGHGEGNGNWRRIVPTWSKRHVMWMQWWVPYSLNPKPQQWEWWDQVDDHKGATPWLIEIWGGIWHIANGPFGHHASGPRGWTFHTTYELTWVYKGVLFEALAYIIYIRERYSFFFGVYI